MGVQSKPIYFCLDELTAGLCRENEEQNPEKISRANSSPVLNYLSKY